MTVRQMANRTLVHWKALLVVLGLGLTGSLAASGLGHLLDQIEIRHVRLAGDLRYLDATQLESELSMQFAGRYLDTALGEVITTVQAHPWIEEASARRVWPDTLLIEVIEQRPVAIYNDTLYLGQSGDLFQPPVPVTDPLPKLYGALSETMQVYSHYGVFADRLSGLSTVVSVARGQDMGWEVTLDNGVVVRLGRTDVLGRLARARDIMGRLSEEQWMRLVELDARYGNGVALAWRDAP